MLNYQKEPKIHSDLKLSNHCQSESTVISQKTTNDPDQKEKKSPGTSWEVLGQGVLGPGTKGPRT